MSVDEGLVDWVAECLEPMGSVTMRKMMGGAVLYCEGTVFALVSDSDLYLKSDAENAGEFEAEGLEKFEFAGKDGKIGTMNYRAAPLDAYDDPEAMRRWARLGIEAGLRAPKKKLRAKKRTGKKS
ncbi:TfoX/Sxy family protein [Parasphingopyxis lamellibrachiae]|uniref:DNA transformation protein n=1 Tax=Parasphingopyxis lamellibrachiae TaxID=680125 RepID=A0A3D9FJL7_9SPHN|nr:TfoX/Sxy family protein [Parasphingopyxis lamellibrachiae]RED17291.1 DNA transformation protein [Parasphingopyxis lamellibrachiae]